MQRRFVLNFGKKTVEERELVVAGPRYGSHHLKFELILTKMKFTMEGCKLAVYEEASNNGSWRENAIKFNKSLVNV